MDVSKRDDEDLDLARETHRLVSIRCVLAVRDKGAVDGDPAGRNVQQRREVLEDGRRHALRRDMKDVLHDDAVEGRPFAIIGEMRADAGPVGRREGVEDEAWEDVCDAGGGLREPGDEVRVALCRLEVDLGVRDGEVLSEGDRNECGSAKDARKQRGPEKAYLNVLAKTTSDLEDSSTRARAGGCFRLISSGWTASSKGPFVRSAEPGYVRAAGRLPVSPRRACVGCGRASRQAAEPSQHPRRLSLLQHAPANSENDPEARTFAAPADRVVVAVVCASQALEGFRQARQRARLARDDGRAARH